MSWDPQRPWNDLKPPPPVAELESSRVLKVAIDAARSLARLDQAVALIPNPAILINTIPLIEAQASSEIENIVTTTDDLFRFIDEEESADPATREALRYRTALRIGFDEIATSPVSLRTATTICSTIKGREMALRELPGTRLAHPATGHVTYSPPEGREVLLEKISAWERFIHADDGMDPLVRMAVAHYQFEAIHPYSDGNGRTGRILNILLLIEQGALRWPVLYLSRYLIATKDDYYRRLLAVTAESAWEDWIIYILQGIELTARSTLRKITQINEFQDEFARQARSTGQGAVDVELLAVLFEQPYCRIGTVMARCAVSRPTATRWLTMLARGGLLEDVRAGRDRLFINRQLLDLLIRDEGVGGEASRS